MKDTERILVAIYADSTGLFNEYEIMKDNIVEMGFPKWIVEEWYNKYKSEFNKGLHFDQKIPLSKCNFNAWLKWYICDETDGLYQFAVERHDDPDFGFGLDDKIGYDDGEVWITVFEGDYLECRKFGREHDWKWIDDNENEWDLELTKS